MFLMLMLCVGLFADFLPKESKVPGGVAILKVVSQNRPNAYHNDQKLMVLETNKSDEYDLLIGFSLDENISKPYEVIIEDGNNSSRYSINLKDKKYKKQYITMKNDRYVTPKKMDYARISSEKKDQQLLLKHFLIKNSHH